MPPREPLTILVINDIGEEVKLVTLSFRGFFPGCRVEAVYSLDEAIQWSPRADWHLLLIDERLVAQRSTPILPELKRLAPDAVLVLQTDRSDAAAAINALQAGADFLLYKKSPAFLTELMLYTKDAVEKRELRKTLERTQERHGRLIDTLADVLYELDAEGRFVFVSPSITAMLGYAPEELTNSPYSTVVPPDQLDRARYRLNDRRTGARASRFVEIELTSKAPAPGQAAARVRAEISAKGLYDPQRRFSGTLGLLRDVSKNRGLEETIVRLEAQLKESDRVADMARRLSTLSQDLQSPLTAVLAHSQQLLRTIHEARLDEQVTSLVQHAAEAVRQGEALSQTMQEAAGQQETLNDVLDAALAMAQPPLSDKQIERQYAMSLPPFTADRDVTILLFRTLLGHAQAYLAATGRQHRLLIRTVPIGPTGSPLKPAPTLFPSVAPVEVQVRIAETDSVVDEHTTPSAGSFDLIQAYACAQQLRARFELLAPVQGLLSVTVWLPVGPDALKHPHPFDSPSPGPLAPPTTPANSALPLEGKAKPEASSSPSIGPLKDRRETARVAVHLPARITIGNTTREGRVTNISPAGAAVEVEGVFPSLEGQPAYVLLKTSVSILELQATTQDRGVLPRQRGAEASVSRFAFRFTGTGEVEHRVLASLIEEARFLPMTVEALLSFPEDLPDLSVHLPGSEQRGTDHREAIRVRMALPARVETPLLHQTAQRPLGLVINLSRGGACMQMKQPPGAVGEVIFLHFSTTGSLGQPRTHEPEAPEAVLAAKIVWMAPDPGAPSELKPSPLMPGQRIGVRFVQLTSFAEREISRVVGQHIGSAMDLEGIVGRSAIVSARRECRNAREQVIAVTDDHARHYIAHGTAVVIVVPGFGRTQTDYLPLAFSLASRRFRVLRYDHTNHVGQSDGDVLQTTLRSMQIDLQKVIEFARTTWPTAPVTVVAEDVGARVAVKVMAQTGSPGSLLLVNPVLDLQKALSTMYHHDVLTDYRQGLRRGIANLWGLNINLDQFLSDAIAGAYADLSTTMADFSALSSSPTICTSRKDDPSTLGQLDSSLRAVAGSRSVISLQTDLWVHPDTVDERHLSTFHTIFKQITEIHSLERHSFDTPEISRPAIQRQQQLEQERVRIRHHVSQAARDALWIAHIAQLSQLGNLHEYWLLRDELYRQLTPLEAGMTILDIGCGQGDLARAILTNQAYRLAHDTGPAKLPLQYMGLGQSEESLHLADRYVDTYARELTAALPSGPSFRLLDTHWIQFDWNSLSLCKDQSVTKVIFHLSLAFCPSPLDAIRQALQLLNEEGTLVITCLQPHTDLSTVFLDHLRSSGQDEFTPAVQVVLHYFGRLREAIRHGLLHSYERDALQQLLLHAGALPIRIQPLLNSQLLIAVALKGKSPS